MAVGGSAASRTASEVADADLSHAIDALPARHGLLPGWGDRTVTDHTGIACLVGASERRGWAPSGRGKVVGRGVRPVGRRTASRGCR